MEFKETCEPWPCPIISLLALDSCNSLTLVSLLLSYSPPNYHIAAIWRCFTVISFLSFAQNLFSASHLIQNEAKLFAMAQSLLQCYLYRPFVPASLASFLILEHETLFPPGIYTQGSLCLVSSPKRSAWFPLPLPSDLCLNAAFAVRCPACLV